MPTLADILPAAVAAITGSDATYIPANQHIVVLLIDGMGFENLREVHSRKIDTEFLTANPFFEATFPTTTPVSLASLGTGLTPGMHGFVGATFELAEYDTVLHPLKWDNEPNAIAVQPEPTWFEQATARGITVNRIGPAAYAESGLTKAVLRGGTHIAAENLKELKQSILSAAAQPGITYAYYPKLDKTGHIYGVDSAEWRKVAGKVVDMIRNTWQALPATATLIVTADHGMLDVNRRIWIEDDSELTSNVRLITGEPRMRHVFAEPGSEKAVVSAWSKLADVADVMTREQFINSRLLGDVADFVEPRIGDVVAIARDAVAIASRTIDERVSNLIGHHGSHSEIERRIPFAILAGYARG